jgi:hypothetical protein
MVSSYTDAPQIHNTLHCLHAEAVIFTASDIYYDWMLLFFQERGIVR